MFICNVGMGMNFLRKKNSEVTPTIFFYKYQITKNN